MQQQGLSGRRSTISSDGAIAFCRCWAATCTEHFLEEESMSSATAPRYTAADITALEGLEPVRKRPSMYIGGVDAKGLHHLVWEIIDNAVDEYLNGYADSVTVILHKSGDAVTVIDNGRGIPVDP